MESEGRIHLASKEKTHVRAGIIFPFFKVKKAKIQVVKVIINNHYTKKQINHDNKKTHLHSTDVIEMNTCEQSSFEFVCV